MVEPGPRPDFLPSPEEIYGRGEAQRWMVAMRWKQRLIDSIMLDDHLNINVVRSLVYKYGPEKALEIILDFADIPEDSGDVL